MRSLEGARHYGCSVHPSVTEANEYCAVGSLGRPWLVWNHGLFIFLRAVTGDSCRAFSFILALKLDHLRHEKTERRIFSLEAIWDKCYLLAFWKALMASRLLGACNFHSQLWWDIWKATTYSISAGGAIHDGRKNKADDRQRKVSRVTEQICIKCIILQTQKLAAPSNKSKIKIYCHFSFTFSTWH